MRVWTNTTFRALDLLAAPEPTTELLTGGPNVDSVLADAVRAGAVCQLTRRVAGQRKLAIEAKLERVGSTSLTIGRPAYRPGQKGLAAGEALELRIGVDGACFLGETHVLAKFAPDGDGGKLIAYRLAKPNLLIADDRRGQERIGIAYADPPRAELVCAPRHKPLGGGPMVDLSTCGLRLRASDANVRAGDRVVVRAKLNEDIRLHAMGIVVYAGPAADGTTDVGVRFQESQPEIERFIRVLSHATAETTARRAR